MHPVFRTRFPSPILALALGLTALSLSPVQAQAQTQKPEWVRKEQQTLNTAATDAAPLEGRLIKLAPRSPELPPVTVHLLLYDPAQYGLRVVDDPGATHENLRSAMESIGAVAGVNGGYFHPDYQPLGLVLSGGQELHPQETAKLLSGLVLDNGAGAELRRPSELERTKRKGPSPREGLQAGPLLVDGGKVVGGLNDSKSSRRTVVVELEDGRMGLVSFTAVTLAEAGRILASDLLWPQSHTRRALNMDGGSSTGFYLRGAAGDRGVYLAEFGRVRNYLGLVPRG